MKPRECLLLLTVAGAAFPCRATEGDPVTPPARIRRAVAPCEVHVYRLQMVAGETLSGHVEQNSVDIQAVMIRSSDGVEVARSPGRINQGGNERIVVPVSASGEYRLELRATEDAGPQSGSYVLDLVPLRTTTENDLASLAGEQLLLDAVRALHGNTPQARDSARRFASEALAVCRRADAIGCQADALMLLAHEHWFSGQDARAAIDLLVDSLPLRQQSGDRFMEGETLNDLGVIAAHLGDLPGARDYLERAVPLRTRGDGSPDPLLLLNIGPVYWALGEWQKAIDGLKTALEIWSSDRNGNGEAYALNMLGHFSLQLGDAAAAKRHYSGALTRWKRTGHPTGVAEATMRLGTVAEATGERRRALELYRESLVMSESVSDPLAQGKALVKIGGILTSLGERSEAKQALDRALQIFRTGKFNEIPAVKGLGDLHAKAGDHDQALEWYRRTLALAEETGEALPAAEAFLAIARIERDRGRWTEALASLERATSDIERLRLQLASPEVRASYLASQQSHYDLMIDVLMRMGRTRTALEVSERARARGLLDALTVARVRASAADRAIIEREESTRQRLNGKASALSRMTAAQRGGAAGAALRREIEGLLADYRAIRDELSRLEGGEAAEALSVDAIQALLDDETMLLEYALGDPASHLWVVTNKTIRSFQLPPRREIDRLARRVIELLPLTHRREVAGQARLALKRLGDAIVGPAARLLGQRRLIIVADGALQFVSFAAIPDPASPQEPLMVRHEVVVLPSASVLAAIRSAPARKQPDRSIAVVADPVFTRDDERLQGRGTASRVPADLLRSASAFEDAQFLRLPHTRDEAERIAALAPSPRTFRAVGFRARRDIVTKGDLSKYQIVHFATHGVINTDHPELSGLVLSLYDEKGRPQDGFLRLGDIYAMRLSAELVVLSACRTALGKELRREGLLGLTRGFMYAGAPRVVASLWDVRDRATAELMHRFYHAMLRDGLQPAAALRQAQIAMWREPRWREPFYWAAFTLQGDWR